MKEILIILFIFIVSSYSLVKLINSYYKYKAYKNWLKHPDDSNTSREGMVFNKKTGKLEADNSFKYPKL